VEPAELLAHLEAGNFEAIVGTTEDRRIDFKGQPYDLGSERGKYELAKDVASFASGRLSAAIVIGVATVTMPDSPFSSRVLFSHYTPR
jgi:hypothetical protein